MARCAVAREKVLSLPELLRALEPRGTWQIALTNGCFDLIHVGHIRSLEHAAAEGDVLVVGINDDASVRLLKGEARPLIPANERAELLAALACVDYVTIFPERTAEALVAAVRPDVYVKGGDYDLSTLPEARIVAEYGGRIALTPFIDGRSTSSIVNQIRGFA